MRPSEFSEKLSDLEAKVAAIVARSSVPSHYDTEYLKEKIDSWGLSLGTRIDRLEKLNQLQIPPPLDESKFESFLLSAFVASVALSVVSTLLLWAAGCWWMIWKMIGGLR